MSAIVQIGFDGKPVMAGLGGLEARLGGFAKKAGGVFSGAFGAMGSGLLAGIGVGAIKQSLNAFDDLADTSLRLNESVEVLQRVGFAAEILAGVDLEGLTSQFLRLEKSLGEVGNEKASAALANLGISAESLARLPLDEKILVLSKAFQQARESGTGYNDLLALMGKSAGQLIPLLSTSAEEIRNLMDSAVTMNAGGVASLAALNDRVDSFVMNTKAGLGAVLQIISQTADVAELMFKGKGFVESVNEAMPNEDAGEEDRKRKRETAAAAQEAARAAELEAGAREKAMEAAARKEQAMEGVTARLREQYGQAQFDALQSNADLEGQIANLKQLQTTRAEELRREMEAGPLTEQRMLEFATADLALEQERLGLQKQLNKSRDDEAKKAKDEAEARDEAVKGLMVEAEILAAKAAGQEEVVKRLEREEAIRERVKQIVEQTGLSQDKALAAATKLQDLTERAEKSEARRGEDVERRIQGFSAEKMGGAEEARGRAAARRAAGDEKRAGAYKRSFGGLDEFYADQKDPGFARARTPALDAFFGKRGEGEAGVSMRRAEAAAQGVRSDPAVGILSDVKALLERNVAAAEALSAA
ncbi:MAG: hypothetical protein QE274_00365 [Verrucomicrobiaceae bacterium]|nr:hypothetical protein [Verrucomicrobiaceae bacterium]